MTSDNWERAIKEVQELFKQNSSFAKEGDSGSQGAYGAEAPHGRATPSQDGYDVVLQQDLLMFFDKELVEPSVQSATMDKTLEIVNRGLGDIVQTGPKNLQEYSLMITASMFLEPQQFRHCVEQNASPQVVLTMVRETTIFKELQAERLQMHEKEQQIVAPAADYGKGLLSLGEYFGITKMIEEIMGAAIFGGMAECSIENANTGKLTPPDTPDVQKNSPTKGI